MASNQQQDNFDTSSIFDTGNDPFSTIDYSSTEQSGNESPTLDFGHLDRINPLTIAPALGVYAPGYGNSPEYLFAEDYTDYRKKSWGEQLMYWTGVSYLSGAVTGGSYGCIEGLRSSGGKSWKLRVNAILNASGRRGAALANACGNSSTYVFRILNPFDDHYIGDDAVYNYALAGISAGLVYKSTAGLKPASIYSTGLVDRPFQVATDSISWLVRYNHRVLAPCFGQSFLRVHELNANYAPFLVAYSRALKRLHAVESQDEGNRRIQYKYRRIYALTQIGLPSIPLSFCEVVFLPQPATSLHQIEELIKNDESNLSTSYPTVIEHIRSFMLPRMNFSRLLLNRVMRERIPQVTKQTDRIYSLSRLGDFVDWLWRYFILRIGTREFPVSMPKDVYIRVETVLSILYGDLNRQPLRMKSEFSQWDYSQLEQEKELLLSLCALYICYVKRLKGLPYDALATFHLGNGAELSDICWMGDNSPTAMAKNLCMMALFSYRLECQEENVIVFSTEGKIVVSEKVKTLLDRLPYV
ncbi:hypothetical protein Gasu2_30300 [Galdieria sulphuraria]|nr:hypothetical protein Gasu2_30300 [Galdieria sulphuraria]